MDEMRWMEKNMARIIHIASHANVEVIMHEKPTTRRDAVDLYRIAKVVPMWCEQLAIVCIEMNMNDEAISAILDFEENEKNRPRKHFASTPRSQYRISFWQTAYRYGNLEILAWLSKTLPTVDTNNEEFSKHAAGSGDIKVAEFLDATGHFDIHSFIIGAALHGRLNMLGWALDRDPSKVAHSMEFAAKHNRLGMCKWIHEHYGIPKIIYYPDKWQSYAMVRWFVKVSPPAELKSLLSGLPRRLVLEIFEEYHQHSIETGYDPMLQRALWFKKKKGHQEELNHK
jgi:hypothetical protein